MEHPVGGDHRHKTQKKPTCDADTVSDTKPSGETTFANLLEDSAREAYTRPWHRIERGLRLNRLRIFVEDISPQFDMTKEEKDGLFLFLQKALDKKLLNTLKVVNYDQETQRITAIKGLEMKRAEIPTGATDGATDGTNPEGISPLGALKWGFSAKKPKTIETRKRKKEEVPSVSTNVVIAQ
uniref:Uncharacterized protein n=1 Tax=viral metagenome TaxID=1070528 RepID=A0A6C0IGW0_9ZZZZ